MDTIQENIKNFLIKFNAICKNNDVNPSSIELALASKKQDFKTMIEVKQRLPNVVFAENIAQEFVKKYNEHYAWDFIGRIQTNKIKYLIGKTRLIQSVDRLEIVEMISKISQKKCINQSILIQINAGNEGTKGGISLDALDSFLTASKTFPNILVKGLMVITPAHLNNNELSKLFLASKQAFNYYNKIDKSFSCLSMGMSSDYEIAIEFGSNMIRIGRAIFGERV